MGIFLNEFYCSCGTCPFGGKGIQGRSSMEDRGVSQAAVCELPECVCVLGDMGELGWQRAGHPTFQEAIVPGAQKPPALVLAQVDMSWLLCRAWKTLGVLGLAHIAPSIWRNVQKNQRWASNLNQSHRKGQVWGLQVRPGSVLSRDGDSQLHIP